MIVDASDYTIPSNAVLFFYPKDFTFVCPTELIELGNKTEELRELGYEVIAISYDNVATHAKWQYTGISSGGIGTQHFIHLADPQKYITHSYHMEHPEGVPYRGVVIQKDGLIRVYNRQDLPLGRNINEIVRLAEAINYTDKHGEVCPANWNPGDKTMKPTQEGLKEYLK